MQTLRYRSNNNAVYQLKEILIDQGYNLQVSNYFDKDTDEAVKNFQKKNDLVVDGIVGSKTWAVLLSKGPELSRNIDKLLSEKDLIDVAQELGVELPAIKAVNEVESSGAGFLLNGWCKILFEGHIFWRQLHSKGYNPEDFLKEGVEEILHKDWYRDGRYYQGGMKEHYRLQKAAALSMDKEVSDAAHEACSWGSYQIMGFHAIPLGYSSVEHFVSHMNQHEREHLHAFSRFIQKNNLVTHLKSKDWRKFARGYNGSGNVDVYSRKLETAYEKYK
ncbi:N-acetylmuramidase domain-containing protein [Christiangramia crocea]|uniref:N-acetylmuramidase family protein n=1 Tax=Christiangramia crocea TaxID=2904124 RepID=A0A9X1UYD4_9FLAO|nr:N-acetylmuramidase family protein [Gramella crocea]MCG9972575.1 N-acetylmuramidase family protein [Gramella crocea]